MNITECFQMRKRRSIDKTPRRSPDNAKGFPQSPAGRLRCTPRRLPSSTCNTSFSDQSLEIIWDNNSPSPARTLSLGKRKKHYGSDSSSSGGEISDLVQKLADKSGQTPDTNPPLLALWMSRETNATLQKLSGNGVVMGNHATTQKGKEFQTPSKRPRRVHRKCNKSKMKLIKQDIELLCNQLEKTEDEHVVEKEIAQESSTIVQQRQSCVKLTGDFTGIKLNETSENGNKFSTSSDVNLFDGWGTDEDDIILSQVEIPCFKSNIPETQIMTNTQSLDSGIDAGQNNIPQKSSLSKDQGNSSGVDLNDDIVTESWDFLDELGDSDDEDILESALEDFEKSQQLSVPTVRRVSDLHVKPGSFQREQLGCSDLLPYIDHPQTRSGETRLKCKSSALQRNWTAGEKSRESKAKFSFVPRSMLRSATTTRSETFSLQQAKRPELANSSSLIASNTGVQGTEKERPSFQKLDAQRSSVKQQENAAQKATRISEGTFAAKPTRYSKEDIERKKLEAQNRRKQKMAQGQ